MERDKTIPVISHNEVGWYALRHRDGWWLGDAEGVICYADHEIACAANTIVYLRENRQRNFKIALFDGNPVQNAGEHTPPKTIKEINWYTDIP